MKKEMGAKKIESDMPIGKLRRIKDTLPPPEKLVVQEEILTALRSRKQKGLINKYKKGYLRNPEKPSHLAHIEKVEFKTLSIY